MDNQNMFDLRLMSDYADYCAGISKPLALLCLGKAVEALEALKEFRVEFGKRELGIERYYDQFEATHALEIPMFAVKRLK